MCKCLYYITCECPQELGAKQQKSCQCDEKAKSAGDERECSGIGNDMIYESQHGASLQNMPSRNTDKEKTKVNPELSKRQKVESPEVMMEIPAGSPVFEREPSPEIPLQGKPRKTLAAAVSRLWGKRALEEETKTDNEQRESPVASEQGESKTSKGKGKEDEKVEGKSAKKKRMEESKLECSFPMGKRRRTTVLRRSQHSQLSVVEEVRFVKSSTRVLCSVYMHNIPLRYPMGLTS